ncbi:hypothetical protein J4H92_00120 [Leucobacter weissii]|uniref:CBU-0592-like domain-containing protein n=1 Tax=Leucobacter weissii TaxID=1983706 RepID=A0A939MKK6_9MICO|nr:hypothetical protein [Leucobacter weissii]MBO1900352.1 hypothetical protein [Leucobacter weissii]
MDEFIGGVLGWTGTLGTFSAYVLIWRGWTESTGRRYLLLNAVGGFLASAGALAYGAWPAVISNLVWGLIGVQGLLTPVWRRSAPSRDDAHLVPAAAASSRPSTASPGEWNPSVTDASAISLPWLLPARDEEAGHPTALAAPDAAPRS